MQLNLCGVFTAIRHFRRTLCISSCLSPATEPFRVGNVFSGSHFPKSKNEWKELHNQCSPRRLLARRSESSREIINASLACTCWLPKHAKGKVVEMAPGSSDFHELQARSRCARWDLFIFLLKFLKGGRRKDSKQRIGKEGPW